MKTNATATTAMTVVFSNDDRGTFRARKNPARLYRGKWSGRCWLSLERQEAGGWTRVRAKSGRLSHLTLADIVRTIGMV